jgi:hypothetical protein
VFDAELTDRSGFLQWRGRTRQVANASGQVEVQIAGVVADEIARELGLASAARNDMPIQREALEYFLQGIGSGSNAEMQDAMEKALEIEPDYAEALYILALIKRPEGPETLAFNQERLTMAERAAAMARGQLSARPQSGYLHYVLGRVLKGITIIRKNICSQDTDLDFCGESLFEHADEYKFHLQEAVRLDPGSSDAWLHLADTLPAGAEHEALLQQALDADPYHQGLNLELAKGLNQQGRIRDAILQLQRVERVGSSFPFFLQDLPYYAGLYDEAFGQLIRLLQNGTHPTAAAAYAPHVLYLLGLVEEGDTWRQRFLPLAGHMTDYATVLWNRQRAISLGERERIARQTAALSDEEILADLYFSLEKADDIASLGDTERAVRLYAELVRLLEAGHDLFAEPVLLGLAALYRQSGQEDAAERLIARAIEQLNDKWARSPGTSHPRNLYAMAAARAMQGNTQEALAMLRLTAELGFSVYLFAELQPIPYRNTDWFQPFAALESDPEFQSIMQWARDDIERQRQHIRRLLAENDLDALLRPLLDERANR